MQYLLDLSALFYFSLDQPIITLSALSIEKHNV